MNRQEHWRVILVLACVGAVAAPVMPRTLARATRTNHCAELAAAPERWKGSIDLGAAQLHFSLDVDRAGTPVSGTLSIPEQGVKDSALKAMSVDGDRLRFTFGMAQMPPATHATFDVVVAADGQTAKGTMKQMGRDLDRKSVV